jgi:uncharacterized protein
VSAPPLDVIAEVAGERLRLLPERAAFWERRALLLVADPHWGKTTAFRAAGLAVPGGTTAEGLRRLEAALARTGARRLAFLGDFFHARAGRSPATLEALARWRATDPALDVLLVRGNHDRHAGDPPPELGIRTVDGPVGFEPPFVLAHHPHASPDGYVLAGHLHPVVALRGTGRQRQVLPCFHFGTRLGVLPAFGGFTGAARITAAAGDRIFVVAGAEVVEVEVR